MIRLQNIVIQNYKLLRFVNLTFPERASVLIEGYNESGKSSLFEAIYFALYGDPLVVEDSAGRGRGKGDSVIRYNAQQARVILTLQIDDLLATVERTINRTSATQAKLTLLYPDKHKEIISGQTHVTPRLIQEMGSLTSDALLNSCFVEQKKLGKLEDLSRADRQTSLESLLNLSHLSTIQESFAVTQQDKQDLLRARQQLEIAQIDLHIPQYEQQCDQMQRQLTIRSARSQWEQLQEKRQAQQRVLENSAALQQHRQSMNDLQHKHNQLAQQEEPLRQLLQMTDRKTQLEKIQVDLGMELEHINLIMTETLPQAQRRGELLAEALDCLQQQQQIHEQLLYIERERATAEQQQKTIAQLHDSIAAQHDAIFRNRQDLAQLDTKAALTRTAYHTVVERQALERWIAGKADAGHIEEQRQERIAAKHAVAQQRSGLALQDTRFQTLAKTRNRQIVIAIISGLVALSLLFVRQYWGSALLLVALGALVFAWRTSLALHHVKQQRDQSQQTLITAEHNVISLAEREKAWQELGGGQRQQDEAAQQLRNIGKSIPVQHNEAQKRMQALPENTMSLLDLQEQMDQAKQERDLKQQTIVHTELQLQEQQQQLQQAQHIETQTAIVADETALKNNQVMLQQRIQEYMATAQNIVPDISTTQIEIGKNNHEQFILSQEIAQRQQIVEQLATIHNDIAAIYDQAGVIWHGLVDEATGQPYTMPVELQRIFLEPKLTSLQVNLAKLAKQIQAAQSLAYQEGETATHIKLHRQQETELRQAIIDTVQSIGIFTDLTNEIWIEQLQNLDDHVSMDQASIIQTIDQLKGNIASLKHKQQELVAALGLHADITLDFETCQAHVMQLEREIRIKEHANILISGVRERMLAKVLPKTVRNMNMLLPILTMDRYRECEITSDYKLRIFEEEANRLVSKNVFSGGARDQFSLALRLAFALATLPEELGTTPGFIFLDEPLSSFDSPRSEALINLLTKGQIQENFSQIFVISHNRMFDRSAFSHHLRLEQGEVVESTLPLYQASAISSHIHW